VHKQVAHPKYLKKYQQYNPNIEVIKVVLQYGESDVSLATFVTNMPNCSIPDHIYTKNKSIPNKEQLFSHISTRVIYHVTI
jgi:hypothetical protein